LLGGLFGMPGGMGIGLPGGIDGERAIGCILFAM